jgi:Alpha galactosidase A/Alpha galactosidase C-terminal beta sandwich domain
MQFSKSVAFQRIAIAIAIIVIIVFSGAGAQRTFATQQQTGSANVSISSELQKLAVDQTPVMGWSSWSFLRLGANASQIEGEAHAMISTGLAAVGYEYINIDDGWYQCPGPQGPNVDQYGRWVINGSNYPAVSSENGIKALAEYVHSLGLKFGIYLTPGISEQAVLKDTQVLDTSYTADEIATKASENNYNCGGMVGLNYSSPGAQSFVNSVVNELASWGVDYIKLDGITNNNVPDIQAWSAAIVQSGRPIVLDITQGSFNLKIAPELKKFANQWEFAPDIEINGPDEGGANSCNSPPYLGCLSVFPLTSYSHWMDRFNDVANWQPYGGPGGFNDYDSIEVGNGQANSGMTLAAQESQLSLWALGSAPLILGSDLTSKVTNVYGTSSNLHPVDLKLLTNRQVIKVDQDAIDASRILFHGTAQVFAKVESSGDGIVGLFDTNTDLGAKNDTISVSTVAIGLPNDPHGYLVQNLWTGQTWKISSTGIIRASVVSEGVVLYRVTPL